jgi:hypothetical protein
MPTACACKAPKVLGDQTFTRSHTGGFRRQRGGVFWGLPIGDRTRDESLWGLTTILARAHAFLFSV